MSLWVENELYSVSGIFWVFSSVVILTGGSEIFLSFSNPRINPGGSID